MKFFVTFWKKQAVNIWLDYLGDLIPMWEETFEFVNIAFCTGLSAYGSRRPISTVVKLCLCNI